MNLIESKEDFELSCIKTSIKRTETKHLENRLP